MELTPAVMITLAALAVTLLVGFFGNNWWFRFRQHFGDGKRERREKRADVDFRARKQANATIERMNQYFERHQGPSDMPTGILGDFTSGRMLNFVRRDVQNKWEPLKEEIKRLCNEWKPGAAHLDSKELWTYHARRDDFQKVATKAYDPGVKR